MSSRSLRTWCTTGARALDEIEAAHAAVGGTGRGRRYATQQINYAYAILLSSQFQRFCRDLHSEAVDHVVRNIVPIGIQELCRSQLLQNRKLNFGNPNPSNIGTDFSRVGVDLWGALTRNNGDRKRLESLNQWRNAIAHHDFDPTKFIGGAKLQLTRVRKWRRACDRLAIRFDFVIGDALATISGSIPW